MGLIMRVGITTHRRDLSDLGSILILLVGIITQGSDGIIRNDTVIRMCEDGRIRCIAIHGRVVAIHNVAVITHNVEAIHIAGKRRDL